MTTFSRNANILFLDSFCPNLGKNEFSIKIGLHHYYFLNTVLAKTIHKLVTFSISARKNKQTPLNIFPVWIVGVVPRVSLGTPEDIATACLNGTEDISP